MLNLQIHAGKSTTLATLCFVSFSKMCFSSLKPAYLCWKLQSFDQIYNQESVPLKPTGFSLLKIYLHIYNIYISLILAQSLSDKLQFFVSFNYLNISVVKTCCKGSQRGTGVGYGPAVAPRLPALRKHPDYGGVRRAPVP